MKKRLAALMCGVMCVTAFSGCSPTELSYLKLSSDMLNTMSACKAEGTMKVDVDLDAMDDFIAGVVNATAETKAMAGEDVVYAGVGMEGKKSVTVDYDMNMNLESMEYDMSFDVDYEGKIYDLGTLYYSLNKGIYVTGDTLMGVYTLAEDFTNGYGGHYVFDKAFKNDLKKVLAEDEYIQLIAPGDLTGVDMEGMLPEQNMTDLYDAVMTFYQDVLKGFESGMISKAGNTYKIEADGQQAAKLLVDLLDFVADNPEQVINATEAYMMKVLDAVEVGTPEETAAAKQEMQAMFAQARASQEDFVAAAGEMSMVLQSVLADPAVDKVLDAFHYVSTVKQVGNGFDTSSVFTMADKGKNILRVVSEGKQMASAEQINIPASGMTVDQLGEKLTVLENKYNPVTGVNVSWGWDPEGKDATVMAMREQPAFFDNSAALTEMVIKDNRAYLPLRMICEKLGKDVTWDKATKTASVDGKAMKGLLQDGKSFVAVRDFEKLGYQVTFENMDGMKNVLIEK